MRINKIGRVVEYWSKDKDLVVLQAGEHFNIRVHDDHRNIVLELFLNTVDIVIYKCSYDIRTGRIADSFRDNIKYYPIYPIR